MESRGQKFRLREAKLVEEDEDEDDDEDEDEEEEEAEKSGGTLKFFIYIL